MFSAPATPSPLRRARVLHALTVAALLAGCADEGGRVSSPGGSLAPGTTAPAGTRNAATRAHRALAGAALGPSGGAPAAPSLDPAGLDAWNGLIARSWPELRRALIDPRLEAEVRGAIAGLGAGGAVQVRGLRSLAIDTAAPIGLSSGPLTGGAQALVVEAPRAPGAWSIAATVDVAAQVQVVVLGVPIGIGASFDVSAHVSDARVEAPLELDYGHGPRPLLANVGTPRADLRIALSSSDPMLAQVTGPLTQVLDPLVRVALVGAAVYARQQALPLVQGLARNPFRPASRPLQGVAPAPDLEAIAVALADEIRRVHMPWGTVLPAHFDSPHPGQGNVKEYADHGDSVEWTGHFMMGEAMRHDLTGDARALAAVERGLLGFRRCLDVGGAGQGLLGRCVVPVADPLVAQIRGNPDYYEGAVDGVLYGATGDQSRDHYMGALLGCSQAWLRVPPARARALACVADMCDYIQRNDLVVYRKPGSSELSRALTFAQTPGGVWAFARVASVMDPARYGALASRTEPVVPVIWLAGWASTFDVHTSYYKFDLGNDEVVILTTTETDPARYREYVRIADLHHGAVAEHQNACFDVVYGMTVPAAAPHVGPRVRAALERWTLRPRRAFASGLETDPAIAKEVFVSPETGQAETVAREPVPIERRHAGDFIWQHSPFDLRDSYTSPEIQYPGIDLVQPYWAGRAYGMLP